MRDVRAAVLFVAFACYACAPAREVELANTRRLVWTPTRIAALTPASDSALLPSELSFGGSHGRSALFLEFPVDSTASGLPLKAFLRLSPSEGATADATPVVVEAWRINAAWQAAELRTWSDKPALAPPYASEKLSASPARELRIDVTDLLRFAVQNPRLNFGIALLGRGGTGHGASFATGISAGSAPRLEVYVR